MRHKQKEQKLQESKSKSVLLEQELQERCKNLFNLLKQENTTVLYWYTEYGDLQLLPLFDIDEDKLTKAFFDSLAELEDVLSINKRSNEDNDLAGALQALAGS